MAKKSPEQEFLEGIEFHPEYQRLITDVGFALSKWGEIETELDTIFQHLLDLRQYHASLVTGAIESTRTKTKILNALVEGLSEVEHVRDYWKNMYNRVLKALNSRNELAHFSIKWDLFASPHQFKLIPYYSDLKYHLMLQTNGISSLEIRRRGVKFAVIAAELSWLSGELGVLRGIFSANPRSQFRRRLHKDGPGGQGN